MRFNPKRLTLGLLLLPALAQAQDAQPTVAAAAAFIADAEKALHEFSLVSSRVAWINNTYITEDTETGLAFLASAARYAGVDAPIAHGLLAIAGGFLGRDLRKGPRSFEALGLASLSREELLRKLDDGQ